MPRPGPTQQRAVSLTACLLLALLAACPRPGGDAGAGADPDAADTQRPGGGSREPGAGAATISYPPEALQFILDSLGRAGDPAYPSLGQAWQSIALCPGLAHSQDSLAIELRASVGKAVREAGERPPPELVRAWLSTHPEPASEFIAQGFAEGNGRYLTALAEHETLGRSLLLELDASKLSAVDCGLVLDLLRNWGSASAAEQPLLRLLAARSEPEIRLRAAGWLLALGDEPEKQHKLLWDSVRAAKDGNIAELAAAVEGVRISGDATLSDSFAPLLVQVKLGPETIGTQAPVQQVYCAYAASFLPGEGAATINKRLLEAASPRLRWQAALGQLLAGDPAAWNARVEKFGPADLEMWTALASPEAKSLLLLPTYEKAAASEKRETRGAAAQQLNRYRAEASDSQQAPRLRLPLQKLSTDPDAGVKTQAYLSAGMLQLNGLEDGARALLAAGQPEAALRWAAATYLLRLAEPQSLPRAKES